MFSLTASNNTTILLCLSAMWYVRTTYSLVQTLVDRHGRKYALYISGNAMSETAPQSFWSRKSWVEEVHGNNLWLTDFQMAFLFASVCHWSRGRAQTFAIHHSQAKINLHLEAIHSNSIFKCNINQNSVITVIVMESANEICAFFFFDPIGVGF